MTQSLAFVRHFARLAWLFLYEPDAYDAQLSTLRATVAASREGGVTLGHDEGRLTVNGTVVTDGVMGARDLAAQLVRHGVGEVAVEASAAPGDLLLAARLLANDPAPDPAAATVSDLLRAVGSGSVSCAAQCPVFSAAAVGAGSTAVAAPDTWVAEPRPELVREQDPQSMYHAFTTAAMPTGSPVTLLTELDAAPSEADRLRTLDALVKLATESAATERHDIVADILSGLVDREASSNDPAQRRAPGLTLRRLCKPPVLRSVAALLARRGEDYERHMRIMRRAEDAGVETLVDALVSASSLADRRTYFDALHTLNSGFRALLHMLGDTRWYVVRNAAELVGELRVEEAEPELMKLLDHEDERVRSAAAGALSRLGVTPGARGLRAVLRNIHSSVLRHSAVNATAADALGTAEALIRALAREPDLQAQLALVTALGQIGTRAAIDKLTDLANGRSGLMRRAAPALRVAAVHALAATSDTAAMAAICALAHDKQKEVRGAAAWVMLGQRHRRPREVEPG